MSTTDLHHDDTADGTEHEHDLGLRYDRLRFNRRRALSLLGGLGAVGVGALTSCGGDDTTSSSSGTSNSGTSTSTTSATSAGSTTVAAGSAECTTIPEETAGPYPGDGSNGPDALGTNGIVRKDIRSSFGDATGTAEGIPTTIRLQLQDTAGSCGPLSGAAVYLWHCDREGRYSMYSSGAEDENYLRGVQEADQDGVVEFTSIFPACYSGRWPHVHFEVYESLDEATAGGTRYSTSQLAVPEDVCNDAFATDGYEASVTNFRRMSLATDNVFSDDSAAHQLATVTGDAATGYVISLVVPVDSTTTSTGSAAGGPGMGAPGGPPPGA